MLETEGITSTTPPYPFPQQTTYICTKNSTINVNIYLV